MPEDRLQIPIDHIGQVTDRAVMRPGVVREVRDREAEPTSVTNVVPEKDHGSSSSSIGRMTLTELGILPTIRQGRKR